MEGNKFMHLLLDPGILIVIATFVGITTYVVRKYKRINYELVNLVAYLEKFKKTDLSFRFKEFDDGMMSNPYVKNIWEDFKNTLMFSETMSVKGSEDELKFEKLSNSVNNIQCTVEPSFYFNEDTLVTSRLNYKMVMIAPTILTGLGPLFTFMHIGQAFSKVDFTSQENTVTSVGGLMSSMQAAAMVSVLAVGASLIFLFVEKYLYAMLCKKPLSRTEELMSRLFDSISSEKFLIELLRENKKQNSLSTTLLKKIPVHFSDALEKSISSSLLPYMENILYSLNKILEKTEQTAMNSRKGSDSIDDLF